MMHRMVSDRWTTLAVVAFLVAASARPARAQERSASLHGGALADSGASAVPSERDVRIGRARQLVRAGHTDDAIAEYERWLAVTPSDAEAWRELAVQRRRAGRYNEAVAALELAAALDAPPATQRKVARDILRARALARGTAEPRVSGSRDSDGLTTASAGVTLTSPLLGRARLSASTSADRAGDGIRSRGSQDAALGLQFRPLAQLRLELTGGVARSDRSFIDTAATTTAPTTPTTPSGPGRGSGPPIGRPVPAGASSFDLFPVGRARLVWRKPGDALGVDVRASRQLLDASPFLVAQGVLRDEASLAVDLRLAGPIRVRGFGRVGSVHNADESNGRQIFGGALAYVPAAYEVTLRAQTMRYDTATTLAYFSPRQVRTAELTTYFERETDRGITMAVDLGAGAQQVSEWTSSVAGWSPALRGWTQIVVPLDNTFALGTEVEAYDSRVGGDAHSPTVGASQWRYASAIVSLRVRF
jgi:hypothetical protein